MDLLLLVAQLVLLVSLQTSLVTVLLSLSPLPDGCHCRLRTAESSDKSLVRAELLSSL